MKSPTKKGKPMKSLLQRRSHRAIAVLITATVAAVGLTGCGGESSEESGSATSGTVSWWGESTETVIADQYIAAFNEEYPDIEVTYRKLLTDDWEAALRPALASPSGPDVFELQPGSRVDAYESFAEDLTSLAESTLGADWQDKVSPLGVKGLTVDGRLTALAVGQIYGGALWINPDLFEAYDVAVPTTLDEWAAACATFRENGQGCFVHGASVAAFNIDLLQAIAASVEPGLWTRAANGEADWSDPGIVRTFEIWKELFDKEIMQPGAIGYSMYPDANNDFITGKYAMIFNGSWYMSNAVTEVMGAALEGAGVVDGDLVPILPVPFPDVAGEGNPPGFSGDADVGLAVSKKAKDKSAAETFVAWLTLTANGQQQVADALSQIPALIGVGTEWDAIELTDQARQVPALQDLIAQMTQSSELRISPLTRDMQDAILTASTSVADGAATPQEAADAIQAVASN